MKLSTIVAVIIVLALLPGSVLGETILFMPIADHVAAGEVRLSYYHWNLDLGEPANTFYGDRLEVGLVYYGVTDNLELQITALRPSVAADEVEVNFSYQVVHESAVLPNVALGVVNVADNTFFGVADRTLFVAASKNLLPAPGQPFGFPVVRAFAGYGDGFFDGLFGGLAIVPNRHFSLCIADDTIERFYALRVSLPRGLNVDLASWGDSETVGLTWYLRSPL